MGHADEHEHEDAAGEPQDVSDTASTAAAGIDADQIAAQRFSVAFRGYDRGEVGAYLQRVAEAHRELSDELSATRAALDAAERGTSVVGVSAPLDALDLEIDITDGATAHLDDDAPLPGEDDETFDRMVRDALERAVRRSPHTPY